jgi:hypothetical protein
MGPDELTSADNQLNTIHDASLRKYAMRIYTDTQAITHARGDGRAQQPRPGRH